MKSHFLWGLFFISVFFETTLAGNLKAPVTYPSAKVLPRGVRNLRYMGVFTGANSKFSNSHESIDTGNAFVSKVTWNNLISSKATATEQAELQGYLLSKGVGDFNQQVGETSGALDVDATVQVPVLAYGVTDKLTLALAVPIVTLNVRVDTGFVANDHFDAITEGLADSANEVKGQEIDRATQDAINSKARAFHYDELLSEDKTTRIGDIKLASKYQLHKEALYSLTVQTDLTLPTGRQHDLNKLLDAPTGDGQMDVGAHLLSEFNLFKDFSLLALVGYTAQLPDHTAVRVPTTSVSSLSADIDLDAKRDLGDIVTTQLGANYHIWNGLAVRGAWGFQYKARDSYTGTRYDSHRYEFLSLNTEQYMHSAQVGLGYSTLRLFRQKRFPLPLEVNLNHSRVVSGKNVINDPITSLELAIFL